MTTFLTFDIFHLHNKYHQSSSRGQFEAPPPPRFEMTASYERGADKRDRERDYKRDYPRHVSCEYYYTLLVWL